MLIVQVRVVSGMPNWSSILHIKQLRTLFPRIVTYADLDPGPLGVFAWIEEALVIILQIASDN